MTVKEFTPAPNTWLSPPGLELPPVGHRLNLTDPGGGSVAGAAHPRPGDDPLAVHHAGHPDLCTGFTRSERNEIHQTLVVSEVVSGLVASFLVIAR